MTLEYRQGTIEYEKRVFHKGDIVKHFKRQWVENKESVESLYRIIDLCTHSESKEIFVLYQSLETLRYYVRPLEMFFSKVDKIKYPEAQQEFRFMRL